MMVAAILVTGCDDDDVDPCDPVGCWKNDWTGVAPAPFADYLCFDAGGGGVRSRAGVCNDFLWEVEPDSGRCNVTFEIDDFVVIGHAIERRDDDHLAVIAPDTTYTFTKNAPPACE